MIDVRELRIGNLVLESYSGEMIVAALFAERENDALVDLRKASDLPCGRYNSKHLEPIEITSEYLERFGFMLHSRYDYHNYRLPNGFYISQWMGQGQPGGFEKNKAYYWGESMKEIKCVHQLQNLYFALTNEELKLK